MKRLALLVLAYPLSALSAALAVVFFASAIVNEARVRLVVAVVASSPAWLGRTDGQPRGTDADPTD